MSTMLKIKKSHAQDITFKKVLFVLTAVSGFCFILSRFVNIFYENNFLYSAAITFGVAFYHFAMRLAVGYSISIIFKNGIDNSHEWFAPKKFERNFYKKLKVKNWKDKVPTFDPEQFSIENHSLDEIISSMCIAEIVHEVIIIFSLLPIFLAIPFGEFWVFFITSLFSAFFDLIFVILQRYNRPRVIRLLHRKTQ